MGGLLTDRLAEDTDLNLGDCAYTLSTGRSHFEYRRLLIADEREQALAILRDESSPHILSGRAGNPRRRVTFLFPGQGSQYSGMGGGIYHQVPEYCEHVDTCLSLLDPAVAMELRPLLTDAAAGEETPDVDDTRLAQPLLFIVEYALAQTFIAWGVEPDSMIGHSIGEYVAACVAGVLRLEDALDIVVKRGVLMAEAEPGAMLAVNLDSDGLATYLSGELELAAINSSELSVLSGRSSVIEAAQSRLEATGISTTRLKVSHGYHSHLMEPVLDRFSTMLENCAFGDVSTPYYSNLSGRLASSDEVGQPDYWRRHLRGAVDVATAIGDALDDEERIFVELGPGRTLTTFVRKHSKFHTSNRLINTIPPGNEKGDDAHLLLTAVGRLYLAGAPIDWKNFHRHERYRRVPLPGYAFRKTEFIPEPVAEAAAFTNAEKEQRAVQLYEPHWQRRRIEAGDVSEAGPRSYLVFRDDSGLADALEEKLVRDGCRVIPVTRGEEFDRTADGIYRVATGNPRDYALLMEEIGRLQIEVHGIVHAWAVDAGAGKSTRELANDGYYSLLHLATALADYPASEPLSIIILATELFSVAGDENIVPGKALLTGPLRVIPHELPQLRTRVVEFSRNALTESNRSALVACVARELGLAQPPQQVAYRGASRWTREYRPVALPGAQIQAPGGIAVKTGGTYLITGGLGDIGLALAKHIAESGPVNLVLTTRRPMANWKIDANRSSADSSDVTAALLALERAGSRVEILTAGVTSLDDMGRVRRHIETVFDGLDGIVHCAGLPGGGSFLRKEQTEMEAVLAPKVAGSPVLAEAFRDMAPDFVVLCSSITAILGGFGQADYCAANAYLDAFALRSGFAVGTRVISVNWDTWSGIGMAARNHGGKTGASGEADLSGKLLRQDEDEIVFVQMLSANDTWALREHWILGKATLPGAYYIDAATQALKLAGYAGELAFSDILFLSPLLLNEGETAEITFTFQRSAEGFNFTVQSPQAQHVRGHVSAHPQSIPVASSADVSALRSACADRVIDDAMTIAHLGRITSKVEGEHQSELVEFGPRWQNIREIRLSGQQGLALMQLPDAYAGDVAEHRLHPALLDVATAFLRPFHREGIFLPLSYGKLVLYGQLPQTFYSHARLLTSGGSNDKGVLSFDIGFYAADGSAVASIERFTLREIDQASIRTAAAGGTRSLSEESGDTLVTSGLSLKEALWGFDQTLALGAPSVAVAYGDIDRRTAAYDDFLQTQERRKTEKTARPDLSNAYVKPKSDTEKTLAAIWEELLAIEGIGIHDNFFELGGDSLLLVQLHRQIQARLSSSLSITELYDFPTIATLAQAMGTPREEKVKQAAEATRLRAEQQRAARARRQARKN